MREEPRGEFADDEPDYAGDAAADVDAEEIPFDPADPATVPEDEGDVGHAEPPGGP